MNQSAAAGPHAKKPELRALTGLRAVAALAVVLSHTGVPKDAPTPLVKLASWGHIGVPLFFLLSGFVLAYNYPELHWRDKRRSALFYIARIARVMPLYWLMIGYCVAFYFVVGHEQYPSVLLQNIFAVQTWGPDLLAAQSRYNGPGWSIGVEIFFYALFPFLVPVVARIARRWQARGLMLVIAVCAAVSFGLWALFVAKGWVNLPATNGSSAHRWLYRNPLPHLVEFVTGLAIAHLLLQANRWASYRHHLIQTAVVVYAIGLAAYHPSGSGAVSAGSFGAFFLLPFALGIWSLASGRGWVARWLSTAPMVALGAASYALYITHRWFVWQLSTGERIRSSTGLAAWAGVIVTVIVLLLIAEGAHRYVEVPARKWIMHTARRVLGRSSARHAAAAKPAEPALPASTANEERVPSPVIRG